MTQDELTKIRTEAGSDEVVAALLNYIDTNVEYYETLLAQAMAIHDQQVLLVKQAHYERDEARQAATEFFNAYAELAAVLGFDLEMLESGQYNHTHILNKLKLYTQEADNGQK